MKRPKIKITITGRLGKCGCHRGHKVGDVFDFDTDRGKLCPMAMHVAFPYIDILRYGGSIPGQPKGRAVFCCPDVDTIHVFQVEIEEEQTE
ncbi:MAG: TIGR04076 family protein [Lachnospiraceae bacterium]|nr:TIGR04076 family protein [Lachnospiraceae bacterium]